MRPPSGPTGVWPTASSTTRAAVKQPLLGCSAVADTTSSWARQLPGDLALAGVRSGEVTARVVLHLERFVEYLTATYGHDRLPGGAPGRVRLAGPVPLENGIQLVTCGSSGHQAPEWAAVRWPLPIPPCAARSALPPC